MKRKHKVIVEVTFDKPIPSEEAEGTIEFILESEDLRWMRSEDYSIEKMTVQKQPAIMPTTRKVIP